MARIEDDSVGEFDEDTPILELIAGAHEGLCRLAPGSVVLSRGYLIELVAERDEARKERDTLLQTVEDQAKEIERLKGFENDYNERWSDR